MEPPRHGWRTRESLQTALTHTFVGALPRKGLNVFCQDQRTHHPNSATFTKGGSPGNFIESFVIPHTKPSLFCLLFDCNDQVFGW